MRKLVTAVVVLLGLLLPCASKSQTYTLANPPFTHCNLESAYPIQYITQFQCNMPMVDESGNMVGNFLWRQDGIVEVNLPSVEAYPGDHYYNYWKEVSFTMDVCVQTYSPSGPSCSQPGTFSFSWQQYNYPSGVIVTGIAKGTWEDAVACGGRGCVWHYPRILTFQTTVSVPSASLYEWGSRCWRIS